MGPGSVYFSRVVRTGACPLARNVLRSLVRLRVFRRTPWVRCARASSLCVAVSMSAASNLDLEVSIMFLLGLRPNGPLFLARHWTCRTYPAMAYCHGKKCGASQNIRGVASKRACSAGPVVQARCRSIETFGLLGKRVVGRCNGAHRDSIGW